MSEPSENEALPGVDVEGPEGAPPLVFVPGSIFTRKMWVPQRSSLADQFRVVAPDLPGHGAFDDQQFRMEPAVDVVDDVVETYTDGDALVIGLSLGGYVATEYAHSHPEKLDGLILAASSANPVGTLETVTRIMGTAARLLTKSDRVERGITGLAKRWVRSRDIPEEAKAEIVDAGFYPRQFGEAGPELAGKDFREMFAAFPGPALVLNGETDLLMRKGAAAHAEAAQDARVEVVEGAGHVSNLDQPTRFTAAVRDFHSSVTVDGPAPGGP